MSLLRPVLALAVTLALQAVLGRLWPGMHRYTDLLMVPVVWYAVARSQRSAMLVGCAAGLIQDAWFQVGTFGMNGFKKTLLGWLIGGLAARVDLNPAPARLATGAAAALADDLLDVLLRRLLDQAPIVPGPLELALHAALTGLLVALGGNILDRTSHGRAARHPI